MEEPFDMETLSAEDLTHGPVVEETSTQYLGRWNLLVSTTNWEKGRIICEWRDALLAAGVPPASCTDEAWSRCVGNVTPQHVGRLRRVFQRFGPAREQYAGLFWSHFQAALDWSDAEMWLEGAVQNDWSISQMQAQRAQTLGTLEDPSGAVDAAADLDEDATPAGRPVVPEVISSSTADVRPADDAPWDESATDFAESEEVGPYDPAETFAAEGPREAVRPFANLPELPPDLSDPFETLKLAIVHHRLSAWREISRDDVLAALDSLRELVLAPVECAE